MKCCIKVIFKEDGVLNLGGKLLVKGEGFIMGFKVIE